MTVIGFQQNADKFFSLVNHSTGFFQNNPIQKLATGLWGLHTSRGAYARKAVP
jgi:hypothetical protein